MKVKEKFFCFRCGDSFIAIVEVDKLENYKLNPETVICGSCKNYLKTLSYKPQPFKKLILRSFLGGAILWNPLVSVLITDLLTGDDAFYELAAYPYATVLLFMFLFTLGGYFLFSQTRTDTDSEGMWIESFFTINKLKIINAIIFIIFLLLSFPI